MNPGTHEQGKGRVDEQLTALASEKLSNHGTSMAQICCPVSQVATDVIKYLQGMFKQNCWTRRFSWQSLGEQATGSLVSSL